MFQYHIECMIHCTSFTKTPSASKTAPLLFLLVLAPFPFSTIWAYPLPIWRRFQANAFVMEPFFNAKRSLQHTISPYAMLSQRQYVGSNRWLLSSSNSSIKFKSLSSSMICFFLALFTLCFLRLLCCGKPSFCIWRDWRGDACGGLFEASLVIFGSQQNLPGRSQPLRELPFPLSFLLINFSCRLLAFVP